MSWKKANPALIEMLEDAVRRFNCDRRVMFGSPTFFVNGNMFAGVFEDSIILRLAEDDRRDVLARYDEVRPFTPMEGRAMKEYVTLPEPLAAEVGVLGEWLDRAYNFAASLPPKVPRRAKKRR